MPKNNKPNLNSFVFLSKSGCLLPQLMLLNLFFGWLFFKPLHWLIIEGVLILVFLINSMILAKKIVTHANQGFSSRGDSIIDVEAEVMDEKNRLK